MANDGIGVAQIERALIALEHKIAPIRLQSRQQEGEDMKIRYTPFLKEWSLTSRSKEWILQMT